MTKYEEEIRNWRESEDGREDALFRHFEEVDLRCAFDIAREASRLYGVMFGEEPEEFSPIDNLYAACASASARAVAAEFGEMLGIDGEKLYSMYSDRTTGISERRVFCSLDVLKAAIAELD